MFLLYFQLILLYNNYVVKKLEMEDWQNEKEEFSQGFYLAVSNHFWYITGVKYYCNVCGKLKYMLPSKLTFIYHISFFLEF